jgi:hypothetical protein
MAEIDVQCHLTQGCKESAKISCSDLWFYELATESMISDTNPMKMV